MAFQPCKQEKETLLLWASLDETSPPNCWLPLLTDQPPGLRSNILVRKSAEVGDACFAETNIAFLRSICRTRVKTGSGFEFEIERGQRKVAEVQIQVN